MLKFVVWPDKNLTKPNPETIEQFDDDLNALINDMTTLMLNNGGVGIAAPQVGVQKNLFIALVGELGKSVSWNDKKPIAFINPEVLEESPVKLNTVEGCLSFPGVKAHLSKVRSAEVLIKAVDKTGAPFQTRFTMEDSVLILHEYDHLIGRTIADYLGPVQKMMMKKKAAKWNTYRLGH